LCDNLYVISQLNSTQIQFEWINFLWIR